jgi:hypothetical protein
LSQSLGCGCTFLICQIGALAIPALLSPIFGRFHELSGFFKVIFAGGTFLGSLALGFGLAILTSKLFAIWKKEPRTEKIQAAEVGS